jgi:hypothetical protein
MATATPTIEVDPGGPLEGPGGPFDLPTPTIIDEIANAVAAYPDTDVKLEIVDLTFPGNALNLDEDGSFNVKVTNLGALTMKNVTLKAVATNGAEVKSQAAASQFSTEAISASTIGTIAGGGGSNDSIKFFFEAPNQPKPEGTVLVEVTIDSWDATWDYALNKRSGASASPVATFSSEVVDS